MVTAETTARVNKLTSTIRETEEWSGYPAATLYEMAARGIPGFVRNGRNIRVHREVFEAWLRARANGPRNAA